ncbi:MAG: hypothetical protein ACYTFK_00605 [Planctomycetota bacterium]|jgi:hypothetical protein
MASNKSFEQTASIINSLNKSQIKDRLMHFKGSFKFDFTEAYLDSLSTDNLRHILLAATLKAS